MKKITLSHNVDFQGWRDATRQLIGEQIEAETIQWKISPPEDLFTRSVNHSPSSLPPGSSKFRVTQRLFKLCQTVIQANDPERFNLLYQLVYQTQNLAKPNPDLMHRLLRISQIIQAETSRLRELLRFYPTENTLTGNHLLLFKRLAYFEPNHFILEANKDFFIRRYPSESWIIVTPYRTLLVHNQQIFWGPGFSHNPLNLSKDLSHDWQFFLEKNFSNNQESEKTYYWQALPQSALPDDIIFPNGIQLPPISQPDENFSSVSFILQKTNNSLVQLNQTAAECQHCSLWQSATQTVFGEGCAKARLMMVGEQPGDQEDIAGRPFVGPAGQVLNHAIVHAGFDRQNIYTSNAVKHFKFVRKGQRRIHQTPNPEEIAACSFWLEAERELIKPTILLMLGASAARSILGRPVTISRERSRIIPLDNNTMGMVTVHPSYLLRLPDRETKKREYWRFVEDLKKAYHSSL